MEIIYQEKKLNIGTLAVIDIYYGRPFDSLILLDARLTLPILAGPILGERYLTNETQYVNIV